jgi:hypothetical protein
MQIVRNMEAIDALNEMQERAFDAAEALFRWEERGQQLRHAIASLQHERQLAARARHASKQFGVSNI